MPEIFKVILTTAGQNEVAAAFAAGTAIELDDFSLGDSNGSYYEPNISQTTLVNQIYRDAINSIDVDPDDSTIFRPKCVVLAKHTAIYAGGNFDIREIGLWSKNTGLLFAVGKVPYTQKPDFVTQDSTKDLTIVSKFQVANPITVELDIDSTVVVATYPDLQEKLHTEDIFDDFIVSGFTGAVPASSLGMTMVGGIGIVNGKRISKLTGVDLTKIYTASKDTYIDLKEDETFEYVEVSNGAGVPTITTNSERLMKVVTDATEIISVTDLAERNIVIDRNVIYLETETLNVKDNNITLNKNGNDVSAEDAGLTVERTGTDGSLIYDSTKNSKWKCGDFGSEEEIINIDAIQTMSNKTITSSTLNSCTVGSADINTPDIDGGTIDDARINLPEINEAVDLTATSTEINGFDDRITQLEIRSEQNTQNIALEAFRRLVLDSVTVEALVDGVVDEFHDESGVESASKTVGVDYESTNDYYRHKAGGIIFYHNYGDAADTSTDETVNSHIITVDAGNPDGVLNFAAAVLGLPNTHLSVVVGVGNNFFTEIAASSDFDISSTWVLSFHSEGYVNMSGTLIEQYLDANNYWRATIADNGVVEFKLVDSGVEEVVLTSGVGAITEGLDFSVAVVKVGNDWGLYLFDNTTDITNTTLTIDGTDTYVGIGADLSSANIVIKQINASSTPNTRYSTQFFEPMIDLRNIMEADPTAGGDTITTADLYGAYNDFTVNGALFDFEMNSETFTAESQPSNGRLICYYEEGDINAAPTINTDLLFYISRDAGTTWTQCTMVDIGDYDTNIKILTDDIDISGQPAGTSMRWKAVCSENYDFKLHGVALLWD